MRNIFLLLSCLLCLQACNDEKEVDWTPDALTVSCNETLEEAGDGHWKVTLPTEYKGSVKLEIQTDKAWGVEVSYMTTEDEEWITPSAEGGNGSASLSLAIADNKTAKDRKASVLISTKGEIPVKKTITVVQGNVEELLIVGTIDEASFPDDVFITKNAEGAFDVTLPKDFTEEGERQLNILTYQGTATPSIEITYPDEEHKDWVVPAVTLAAPVSASEVKTLALTIKENTANVYREALVNFTATAGDITSKKIVKIVQYGIEEIIWNEDYCQQEREFIISSDENEKLLIATCKNINPADLELSGSNIWLELTQEEGEVYAKVLANTSTNTERKTEIGIKNTKTGEEIKMSLKQGMYGYGIVLGKSLWSIVDQSASCGNNQYTYFLYDSHWATNKSDDKWYTEFNARGDVSDPYVITLDLGENPRKYNSFGFVPRLQWTQQAPKAVAIEISDNRNDWETFVEKQTCFTEAELKGSTNSWNNHYEGIIHWCKLSEGTTQKRYVRLSLYESFQGNGKIVALDEVFVADRSNVE